jgi:hypothetical protein
MVLGWGGGVCCVAAGFVEEAGVVEAAEVFPFVVAEAGAVSELPGLEEVLAEGEEVVSV